MRRTTCRLVVLVALAITLVGCEGPRQPWRHQLVSINAAGTDASASGATDSMMSADGSTVVFTSTGADFGATDTNGWGDVYVRDLTTGTTQLVSVNATGTNSGNGVSSLPSTSADGTRIAFLSRANDLGPTDSNASPDVYLRDLTTGTTTLISVNASGTDASTGFVPFEAPAVSPDGTKVAFRTTGGDFGPVDTLATCLGSINPPTYRPCRDIYVRDLAAGSTELVTVNAAGTNGADYGLLENDPRFFGFSPNNTKLAFVSNANDLMPGERLYSENVYIRDLVNDTTALASDVAPGPDPRNAASPEFSPDGSALVFQSDSLEPTTDNTGTEIFHYDLASGIVTLLTPDADGSGTGNGQSVRPSFGLASEVFFMSAATNLGPTTPAGFHVFRRDLATGTTTLVVTHSNAIEASSDGRFLAFSSNRGEFGPTDTNGAADYYRLDLSSGTYTLVTTNADGTDASSVSPPSLREGQMSADGRRFTFESRAADLGPNDTNESFDVYVADLGGADLSIEGHVDLGPVGTPERAVYEIDVANAGPEAADGVHVGLLLPEGTEFSSASDGCAAEEQVVACDLGSLGVGDRAHVTIRADAPGDVPETVAVVTSDTVEVDGADNTLRLGPIGP